MAFRFCCSSATPSSTNLSLWFLGFLHPDTPRPNPHSIPQRPRNKVLESLNAFEKGMGTVLRNAWTHIEALQTTDIPLLVDYITGVRDQGR